MRLPKGSDEADGAAEALELCKLVRRQLSKGQEVVYFHRLILHCSCLSGNHSNPMSSN